MVIVFWGPDFVYHAVAPDLAASLPFPTFTVRGMVRVLRPIHSSGPNDPADLQREGESERDFLRRIADKDVPLHLTYAILEDADVPDCLRKGGNRRWRNAVKWDAVAGRPFIDLERARLLRRCELERERHAWGQRLARRIEAAEDRNDQAEVSRLRNKRRSVNVEAMVQAAANLEDLDALALPEIE